VRIPQLVSRMADASLTPSYRHPRNRDMTSTELGSACPAFESEPKRRTHSLNRHSTPMCQSRCAVEAIWQLARVPAVVISTIWSPRWPLDGTPNESLREPGALRSTASSHTADGIQVLCLA
jgi:hypothetical protein